jgi:hypothetical protein
VDVARPAAQALTCHWHERLSDAVYDPSRTDNEARSAELARAGDARIDLILLTARHGSIDPASVSAHTTGLAGTQSCKALPTRVLSRVLSGVRPDLGRRVRLSDT